MFVCVCVCVYVCVYTCVCTCVKTMAVTTCGSWFSGTPSAGSSTCSTSSGMALKASGAVNVELLPVSDGNH